MDPTSLIIQLIAGAVGGNVGGTAVRSSSLGNLGNTIVGAIGGVGGGSILGSLIPALAGGGTSVGNIAASGIGGLVLQIVVGMIKSRMGQ